MDRRGWLVAMVLGSAGCSLFAPTSELRAPADAAPTDVLAPDGAALVDGGSPCLGLQPAPFLCADFDDGTPLDAIFGIDTSNGATVTVDSLESRSSPRSLLFTLAVVPSMNQRCSLYKALPAKVSKVTIDVDVRIVQRGVGDTHDILAVRSGSDEVSLEVGTNGRLTFDEDSADAGLLEGKQALAHVFGSQWTHVRWEMVVAGAEATSTITIDGTVETVQPKSSSRMFDSGQLLIGDRVANDISTSWLTRMDNLLVRVEP